MTILSKIIHLEDRLRIVAQAGSLVKGNKFLKSQSMINVPYIYY
jgi:hypothetical protein